MAYALSPIDLIPDFIPVVGLLDDLIIIPLGIALVVRLVPDGVLDDCRRRAGAEFASKKPKVVAGAAVVVFAWIGIICVVVRKAVKHRIAW